MASDNAIRILEYLKKNAVDKEVSKYDIIEDLDMSMATVSAIITHFLKKRGFIEERVETLPAIKSKNPIVIRWIKITPAGLEYDPFEEERRLLREKAEAAALRKQERAEKKAERAKMNSVL